MTTGNIVVGTNTTPLYYKKSWTGTNGKFEPFQGGFREKWNDYSVEIWHSIYQESPSHFGPGLGNSYTQTSPYWTSNDDLALLSKLTQAVKGHGFNLGVAIGEGRQTISLVKQTLLTLGNTFMQLKRGNLAAATRSLLANQPHIRPRPLTTRTLSSQWLELQYGWKPLISDVFESAKAFEQLTAGPRIETIHVTKHKSYPISLYPNDTDYMPYVFKLDMLGSIIYEMRESLSAQRGLGLYDPLSIAWELMPYSFVVDWFLPIGSYLDALNQVPALSGRFLTIKRLQWPLAIIGKKTSTYYRNSWRKGYVVKSNRVYSTNLAIPRPTFKPIDKALSAGHIYNAIALARQKFSS